MPGRQKLSRREAINDFKWRECKETLRPGGIQGLSKESWHRVLMKVGEKGSWALLVRV